MADPQWNARPTGPPPGRGPQIGQQRCKDTVDLKFSPPRCNGIVKRREWRTMSREDQIRYLDAVVKLQTKCNTPKRQSWYDDVVFAHGSQAELMHGVPNFLPWHRVFLYIFERELRTIDNKLFIPYWSWGLDSQAPEKAPVWDKDLFGLNGDPARQFCVTTGKFAKWVPKHRGDVKETHGTNCFSREWDQVTRISAFENLENLNAMITRSATYDEFRQAIELTPHGSVHNNIGGNMLTMYSPNDPIFWLHHCNVDKLWWDFQAFQEQNRDAYNGQHPDGRLVSKNDGLPVLPGWKVSHAMDPKFLCFEYELMEAKAMPAPKIPPPTVPGANAPVVPPTGGGGDFEDETAQPPPPPPPPAPQGDEEDAPPPPPPPPPPKPSWGEEEEDAPRPQPQQQWSQQQRWRSQDDDEDAPPPPPRRRPAPVKRPKPRPKPRWRPPPSDDDEERLVRRSPKASAEKKAAAAQKLQEKPPPKREAPVVVTQGPATPTPAIVVKPLDKEVKVVKEDNKVLSPPSGDRSDLINLRPTQPLMSGWLKKNGINEAKARQRELVTANLTETTNKIPGYVSLSALKNRPDLLVKLAADGQRDFSIKIGDTVVMATSTATNPAQAIANVIARIETSVKTPLAKPIAEVAKEVAKVIGPPAVEGAANPFQPRLPGSKPVNAEALKDIKPPPLTKEMKKVTMNDVAKQGKKAEVAEEKRDQLEAKAVAQAKGAPAPQAPGGAPR